MNPLALGGILKNFYNEVDMTSFDDRLKIQKVVYLLNVKGINLGYDFGLYLYGPYSKDLTRDAYQMADLMDFKIINPIMPAEKEYEKIFIEFIKNIKGKLNDIQWLEIVASYFFIKRNMSNLNEKEIIERILSKRKNMEFGENEIKLIIHQTKGGYFNVN